MKGIALIKIDHFTFPESFECNPRTYQKSFGNFASI